MKYLRRFNTEEERADAVLSSPNVSEVNASENIYYDNDWNIVDSNQSEYWTANWQFIRPADWPNLDIFDWTDEYGAVATYDCSRRIADSNVMDAFFLWLGNYCNAIIERGVIVNGNFVVDETIEVTKNTYYHELLPTNKGRYVVYKITLDNDTGSFTLVPTNHATYSAANRSSDGFYTTYTTCCELQYKIPSSRTLLNPKSPYLRHYKTLCDPGLNGVLTSASWAFNLNMNLEYIDTTGWTLDNVVYSNNASNMSLASIRSLKKIKGIEDWKLSKFNTLGSCFNYTLFEELDLSEWDTSLVTSTGSMFYACINLKRVNLNGWDTSALTNITNMFYYCYNIESIDMRGWDFSKVSGANAKIVFGVCLKLTDLKMDSTLSFAACTQMTSMFDGCYMLENNPLNGATIEMNKVTTLTSMFAHNWSLVEMDMTNWDFTAVTTTTNMFLNCFSLRRVVFPETCKALTNSTLTNCFNLETIIVLATTPPTYPLTTTYLSYLHPNYKIYVPDESVEDYKAATGWLNAASHIYGISELES